MNSSHSAQETREGIVYSTHALQAGARGDRIIWALHKVALMNGIVPLAPTPVISEAYRIVSDRVQLDQFSKGLEAIQTTLDTAKSIGELGAQVDTPDLNSIAVVLEASKRNRAVIGYRQNPMRAAAEILNHQIVSFTL